ncbi:MAG: OsmC family protein [Acidibacillus sp.]|uniref:UPF0033 domain-containing protein n=1 Tax=Sulfoacidibacillus ferrooxidans TaxID=2005001 RepID=A0A9X1V705_9BACL|nr:OsmC family protein [Sulfoacidibacillus ferrooxidans]MCI0182194.1 hypothetical protein [Sulfoacidibacillus ferrooxidans]MCY0893827.1 OsmC family protein [Acidibacillus sp.]
MHKQWDSDGLCDGGDLDCGSGLLLIIKKAMDSIQDHGVLEVHSRDDSVAVDLPAWCRMVGHELLGVEVYETYRAFFIQKKASESHLQAELEAARGYTWSVRIRGAEGLHAKVYARNHSFLAGQSADFGATVDAPSGLDFVVSALGSDLVVGLKAVASRSKVVLDEVECTVRATLNNVLYALLLEDDGSPAIDQITVVLYVATATDELQIKQLFEKVLERSPLYQTLRKATKIDVRIEVSL